VIAHLTALPKALCPKPRRLSAMALRLLLFCCSFLVSLLAIFWPSEKDHHILLAKFCKLKSTANFHENKNDEQNPLLCR